MNDITYDISYTEKRNRLTVAFRMILFIPHYIVLYFWNIAGEVMAVVQWFIILFTGKRNRGIAEFQINLQGYQARAGSYAALMFDDYPKFGTDPSGVPMVYALPYEEQADRLTNGLRLIWAIPAFLVGIAIGIGAFFVTIGQWFTIVFTGKANRGMWEFQRRALHYFFRLTSYMYLTTDKYPKFV